MFSMSDNWNFTIRSIATQQKDGEASIISSMNELKEFGYITYTKHANGKGTYFLDDEPNVENPNVENTKLGKSTPIKNTNLNKNTNSNKPSFKSTNERLYNEYMESKEVSVNEAKIILDYLSYRKDIGKQIKTITPLNSYWKVIVELHIKGYDIKACIEYMKEKEWMTLKEEYLKNSSIIPKQELQENQFIKDGVTYSEVVM